MATLNAFYVRAVGDHAISAIRAKFPSGDIESAAEFIGVTLANEVMTPEQDLMALSSHLNTDVFWLSFQSVVDCFEYHHWQGGAPVRSLVYGCFAQERTWERVEGQPESWEQAVFFDPQDLQDSLDEVESEAERRALERTWQAGELLAGRMEPYLSARECARKVAAYYRFPGWRL